MMLKAKHYELPQRTGKLALGLCHRALWDSMCVRTPDGLLKGRIWVGNGAGARALIDALSRVEDAIAAREGGRSSAVFGKAPATVEVAEDAPPGTSPWLAERSPKCVKRRLQAKRVAVPLPRPPIRPGEMLMSYLEYRNMSVEDFARRMGTPLSEVAAIIDGTTRVTSALARRIGTALSWPPGRWTLWTFAQKAVDEYARQVVAELYRIRCDGGVFESKFRMSNSRSQR